MPTRILHVSDLHFGRNDKPESIDALARLIEDVCPELVIASGDLTHRGLRSQHERAAEFLR
ncbi:MAG: metallophosphoesterase, partial [Actinobacteria bacterium]|nr:metallophosphoesterase [Actinomycetota bacterium]